MAHALVQEHLKKEAKAKDNRRYYAQRKKLQETDSFSKQYHEGHFNYFK